MSNNVLIPRYPGAKSNRDKYPVWDGQTYDVAIVPFAGSGRWCIPALQQCHVRSLVVADADPAVRAVWGMFSGKMMDSEFLSGCIDDWVKEFTNLIDVDFGSELHEDRAVKLFERLCFIHDNPEKEWDCEGHLYDGCDYAAAKILLHKLCFGGNVRSNAQGKLNISLRSDWATAIKSWHYELLWCPPDRPVTIHADWSECFQQRITGKTIAFIDPPYYAPGNGPRVKGGMSKAYAVHGGNPNDNSVLEMFKGAVRAAVDAGCDRIVATNYHGHWLQTVQYSAWADLVGACVADVIDSQWVEYGETAEFMREMGFEWFHDLGPLQTMNNINFSSNPAKAGTTEQRTVRHEGWWERGGVRQHGRVRQLSLLGEVAA